MTRKAKHNIKRGEIRKIGREITDRLAECCDISPKEIIFFGSRVKGRGRKDSDLDVVVIPQNKSWSSPAEYTQLMKSVRASAGNIQYKGNRIDLQVVSSFEPAESGFCYTTLKKGKIKKTCSL